MGPDHPQIEIYNESKHGIAFYANRDKMALGKEGDWVLGRDYSAAPTCATCHLGTYMTPGGVTAGNTHDVGERISWTLRPAISKKQNLVVFSDGQKEDYPVDRPLPRIGEKVETVDRVVEGGKLIGKKVQRTVERFIPWEQRRESMKGVCRNCHENTFVDNFYKQFDDLVALYNDKFAKPATKLIADLTADSVLNPSAPFEHEVQWVYWELWHHEGRRARHGASMMGPDYTHWHGMYEVSKHFYTKFLPEVINAAATRGEAMKQKYQNIVDTIMVQDEHIWMKGLSPKEAEEIRKAYKQRYN
jgi:hydroxylamine dehydrogenase